MLYPDHNANVNVDSLREVTRVALDNGTAMTEEWLWASARCNDGTGNLVDLFFSEQLDDIARAKAVCNECPVREACFQAALVRREPYGVWGGRLFFKGKVLAAKKPRGRPPSEAQRKAAMLSDLGARMSREGWGARLSTSEAEEYRQTFGSVDRARLEASRLRQ